MEAGDEKRDIARSSWQNAVFCEESWESRLIRSTRIQRCPSFSERVGPRIILLESQPGKQRSSSKRSREITTEPIAVRVQTRKKKTCDFGGRLCGKIKASIVQGICAGLLTNQCSCQVLTKIYIDDSLASCFTSGSNIFSSLSNRQFF